MKQRLYNKTTVDKRLYVTYKTINILAISIVISKNKFCTSSQFHNNRYVILNQAGLCSLRDIITMLFSADIS